ncbi:MAG: CHAP domain-containing protein [Capsulimonas sp.]|uniref:CHAP domain-containing protein n=1 Tax=Capsulimonas sp. TaxID=2494211 RepID=UPI003263344B
MTTQLSAADKAARQKAVVARAIEFLGTEETPRGSNRGREVDRFLLSVHCPPGNPWCMAFAYSMFDGAAYTTANGVTFLIPTASCQLQANHAKSVGILVSAIDARRKLDAGWVMLKWDAELGRYAHTGIVESYNSVTGAFLCIEGNTNKDGSREGYLVARQTRRIDAIGSDGHPMYAFIQTA